MPAHADVQKTLGSRRLDIQGLRAVAVLMVVAFHAGLPVPGGFVGVDVFFVISGFVITAMLHREWESSGGVRFRRFYLRRFQRLTPALAVMVTTTMVASAFILSPLGQVQQTAAKTAIGAMLLTANIVIATVTGGYFDAPAATNPLLNTWSLSVEEQFYLAFPAILVLSWVIGRRTRLGRAVPLVAVIAVTVGSFGLALVGSQYGTGPRSEWAIGFYGPFSRAWEFGIGAVLALAVLHFTLRTSLITRVFPYLGAALLLASLWLIDDGTPFPGVWTLLPVVGTVLVILGGFDQRAGAVGRALSSGPAVRIGDWSYSIYLWHWPFIVFASAIWRGNSMALLLAALVSFAPALASYHFVEQPIRSLRDLNGARIAQLVSVTLVVPLAAAVALTTLANHNWFSETVRARRALVEQPFVVAGCTSGPGALATLDSGSCVINGSASGVPVYLVGDSNAGQFVPALIQASESQDRPLSVAWAVGCPFTPLFVRFQPDSLEWNDNDQCHTYSTQTLEWLESQPPGTVVIANSDDHWRDATPVGTAPDSLTSDPEAKLDLVRRGLIEVITRLEAAGHSVLLVQTIPFFEGDHFWEPTACTAWEVFHSTCGVSAPRSDLEEVQGGIRAVVEDAASQTHASVLDLSDVLCPDGVCSSSSSTYPYFDARHLTTLASENLTPQFETAIKGS